MNIFFLHHCPIQCARWMVDKHIVKMPLETCQLLSTAHHLLGSGTPDMYKVTHRNHPSAVWARTTKHNYAWLYEHLVALNREYTYRYDREHACQKLERVLKHIPQALDDTSGFTTPPMCMPEEYKIKYDVINSYRKYYALGKSNLHQWKRRSVPEWIAIAA